MLRQPRFRASRASPAQKLRGLRVVYSKNFSRATFFVFWVSQLVDMFLNNLLVKQIWRKSAVWAWLSMNGWPLTFGLLCSTIKWDFLLARFIRHFFFYYCTCESNSNLPKKRFRTIIPGSLQGINQAMNHCFWTELSVCHCTLCGLALAILLLWYK